MARTPKGKRALNVVLTFRATDDELREIEKEIPAGMTRAEFFRTVVFAYCRNLL